jgi:hypothetical protein
MIKAFAAALCLIWLAAPSLADEGTIAQRPAFRAGDSFTYAERFETVACRTWRVAEVDSGGNMLSSRCGGDTAYFAPDGGITRITGGDGRDLVTFKPKAAPIPFPLTVGTRWTYHFEVSTASQLAAPDIDETCESMAIEQVPMRGASVPAFRIECSDRWSVAFLSGTNTSTLWYAPDARAVVKAVNADAPEWSLQMTDYSFAQP